MSQVAFYFDQNRCMGCNTCVVACKDWNRINPGPSDWRSLSVTESGVFPDVAIYNLVLSCNHCENPACVESCPVGAIFKREEDGIVIVNRDLCQDIRACVVACPFGAPQFGDDDSEPTPESTWAVDHPMQKCTFCWDRWEEGKKPACVVSCPNRALDAGTVEEIEAKYPTAVKTVVGFPQSDLDSQGNSLDNGDTLPCIYFNPRS